ncbi:putative Branched-chain amino acid transport system permease protein LivM (TC 3.A.1.4.1) [Frankia canadensis]|uniref:Putative Branched-chain amino acid transport system permease protein LivM (TC 3.A.1.4.1) n=1 Tax=Frankia canadensis TaxID=1836972 RepID=A0A2I2KY59_9ACTN|nr:branched-chain amino acid ABC transporter permease [Frankia canadensis]SNQ50595.1 putative Branched-chain amino acid transport system permease protein LivM (TC 3.A.1.4.1) [Frankia canadensis]SOU57885.1 putative Branched-chain amino acid transport system permease protein LivM (TC 3.A.1.4.1) [Frankia canadensis]
MIDWFSGNEGYIQGALVAALLAASVQVALRAGVLSFASVGFYGVGAYGTGYLTATQGWGTAPAATVVVIITMVLSWLLALVLARLRALYLAMATIAFVLLVQIGALAWDSVTGGPLGLFGIPPALGTGGVALILAGVLAVNALTQRGAVGRRLLLLRKDEALASALGVNVRHQHQIAFVWSAVLGSLAGISQASLLTVFTPENLGFSVMVSALTALVVGGTWHWSGPLIGGVVFSWFLSAYLGFASDYRGVVEGALTVVVLVFLPKGLAGLFELLDPGRLRRAAAGPTGGPGGVSAGVPGGASTGQDRPVPAQEMGVSS